MKRLITKVLVNSAIVFLAGLTVTPLWWMLVASISPTGEALSGTATWFPRTWTLEHYRKLFQTAHVARFIGNSFFISSTITALALLVNGMAGYAFAKLFVVTDAFKTVSPAKLSIARI